MVFIPFCALSEAKGMVIKMTECYYSPVIKNYYHIDIWKVIFSNPKDYVISIIKGGSLFIIYLISKIFGFFKDLPQIVREKYTNFRLDVLIKTILLYIVPFIMYFCNYSPIKFNQ